MSCRHCCINSKKSFSKTFSFHKIIYKYFAGFFACIKSSLRGYCRSNPLYLDCFAPRCVPHSVCFSNGNARNDRYKKQSCTRCAPRGDDNNSHYEGNARSNPKCVLCFFDNNVASAHCVNNSNRSTQGVETPCYKKLDCFASRCVPHGDDNNKNFQFDKFQRLLSVIYKKNSLTKEISK